MHDFQQQTAEALPELLNQLKAGGYKVVHMVPKGAVTTCRNTTRCSRTRISCRPTTRGLRAVSFAPSASSRVSAGGLRRPFGQKAPHRSISVGHPSFQTRAI